MKHSNLTVLGKTWKLLYWTWWIFVRMNTSSQIPWKAIVTTIPKKGSKQKLSNERGIFRVNVLRNIFMRLMFNKKSDDIVEKMSECNIGGRKGMRFIDNIFIINGIINEVLFSRGNKSIIIQSVDNKQMFDS